ncbi:E3 ubiquitin-protein ligase RNF4-like [Engraulis encrasicolus]|uniref:E3 ubiquitin-protein ligase RNF4-like n=1 Tax=Engraulis encrasicolus TaxID=184585 RepID=UPI002FD2FA27
MERIEHPHDSEASGATLRKKRLGGVCSRRASKRSRLHTDRMASEEPPETIDVENDRLTGEEVVDLTSETSEASVVDLTNADCVVLLDEAGPHRRQSTASEGYVLISDEEEMAIPSQSLPHNSRLRSQNGEVSCLVCRKTYAEITQDGNGMMSTVCGHMFCKLCLEKSLEKSHSCPKCRTKLTRKQYHPVYFSFANGEG